MKRVYVNEKWCLGCRLCEYNCAFANSGMSDMVKALNNVTINPRIKVEKANGISFAVQCRHCKDPICVRACIAGALHVDEDGVIRIDDTKCVGCHSCVMACQYGAIMPSDRGVMQKCELCLQNSSKEPACVKGCPNHAIVYEER